MSFEEASSSAISITRLRKQLLEQIVNHKDCVSELIDETNEIVRHGVILLHLKRLVVVDTAVRDILTLGHLGKLLARWSLLREGDYRFIGWPHRLFDELSEEDRSYYRQSHSLPLVGTTPESEAFSKLIELESNILRRHGLI